MMKGTIVVEQFENPFCNCKQYHLTEEISALPRPSAFYRPIGRPECVEHLSALGTTGALIVRQIMEIPGVTEVSVDQYSVTVHIGRAFLWGSDGVGYSASGIHARILNILCAQVFGCLDWLTAKYPDVDIVDGNKALHRLEGVER
ncbi:MAG: hypothetical protein HYY55_03295 [Candidatus Niyogibacteria bacterium]|nr:MAG: hypothetical protein HYY55_03295 [Candidatus Niyogibacteria bacterium]